MNLPNADRYYPIDLNRLPAGWVAASVGEVIFDIQPGFASGVHNQDGLGVPHLRPMNINREGRLDFSVVKYVPPDDPLRITRGDILFNNTNSPELVGKTTSIDRDGQWAFSNHMTRLRPPDGIVSKFVAHQLHFLWAAGYFRHRCTHHVNQASIASKTLARTVPLAVPPTDEQHCIVAEIEKQLTRLDAAVAALRRIQANLKRYRASVLKATCEGRLVPTEAELARREGRDYEPADRLLARILKERRTAWESQSTNAGKKKYVEPPPADTSSLPHLPEGWTWASVEQLGMVQLGRQRSPKNRSKDYPVQYLRAANITEAGLDLSDVYDMEFSPEEQERYRLRNGDLVLSEASGSADQVGKPAVWRDQLPICCFQNTVIRLRPVLNLSNYLVVCFKNYYASGVFAKVASGVGINHLSAERFSRVVVPLAPIYEQRRIVAEVERRVSVIDELEAIVRANMKRAERLRQAILKRAFEGRLVPQDPNDEPAGALLERIRAERTKVQQTRASRGERSRRTTSRGQRTKAEL